MLKCRTTRLATVPLVTHPNSKVCLSGSLIGVFGSGADATLTVVAWLHYVFSMCFDLITLIISFWYLLGRRACEYLSFGGISRVMIVDGLGYFVLLTAINVVNVVFYKTAPTALQSSAASLGYVITMIGCQRILIHLRGMSGPSTYML